jgi:hypothetical protein
MVFKPNYNQQRMERERLKQAKKEEKLRRKQEAQKAGESPSTDTTAPDAEEQSA